MLKMCSLEKASLCGSPPDTPQGTASVHARLSAALIYGPIVADDITDRQVCRKHPPRQLFENAVLASGHMWMKPVARITPAPKAFSMKKTVLPFAAYGLTLPAHDISYCILKVM